MTSIKDEFEKAFEIANGAGKSMPLASYGAALWAAKWMAKRCAKSVELGGSQFPSDDIRQLAKELS